MLIMHALRYLMAMSLTTDSFDSVSCLNKLPQVPRVNDFRTCREKTNLAKMYKNWLGKYPLLCRPVLGHLTGMIGESQKCLHILANVGRHRNLHVRTLCKERNIVGDWISKACSVWNNLKQNAVRGLATKAHSCPPSAHRTWHSLFRKT